MSALLVVGTQWGDEGKAKVIDYLAGSVSIVVRYQGGANAGHTVTANGQKYIFHLIPSGILYPNVTCVLGGGMVIDTEKLFSEIETLHEQGIDTENRIRIADNAHLLLPFHREIDSKRENDSQRLNIGTTQRGIGVCYSDKVERWGIRLGDLFDEDFYKDRLNVLIHQKNKLLEKIYEIEPIKLNEIEELLQDTAKKLEKYLVNVPYYLNLEMSAGRNILLEGAQGTMLDLDYGTYPYVTSSNPTTGGALIGSGISYRHLDQVIGVSKAYTTRVGEGPFPTEETGELGERLREVGQEFGATTGRPRRCGWFDTEVIKHAVQINGITSLFLTKLDVFDEFSTIKIGIGYECNKNRLSYFPSFQQHKIKPVYEEFPGWKESIRHCRNAKQLPKNAHKYIHTLEKFCGAPIRHVSVGPSREETISL